MFTFPNTEERSLLVEHGLPGGPPRFHVWFRGGRMVIYIHRPLSEPLSELPLNISYNY